MYLFYEIKHSTTNLHSISESFDVLANEAKTETRKQNNELLNLSYAPVRPPLQERRRMSEANHSLSKCGDIRAQIHIGPSQSVSHYFFVPRLDLYQ